MLNKKLFNLVKVSDIIIAVMIIAAIIFAWQYKSLFKTSTSFNNPNGYLVFENSTDKFKVAYPSDIFAIDKNLNKIYHQLANFHRKSLKDGSDLGPSQDIVIIFKKTVQQCDDMGKILKPLAQTFAIGKNKGLKYEMGAEGEGVIYYCLQNSEGKNIFLVERYFLSEGWGQISKEPDFIPSAKQEEIFNKILETLFLSD
ncbi:MAG: hypothetical protein PHW31_02285 [Candidatus Pacebacteria bacterium]|nr:hypothetical protein [Candidatus Paceibacterota bacterium]